ncbi:MAG: Recombination-promoting nuclease RpnA [Anaerolineales bacterium]|nr:Recombination-promoting nuclease RpnA [Anaerolineales bacterium]
MGDIGSPHDHFFRMAFGRPEVARDFLHHYLSQPVRDLVDLSTLTPHKDSFVDEELRDHFSDLLYEVRLHSEKPAYVYLLFEHKSYSEPLIAFQLLRYMVRIWEVVPRGAKNKLRSIIPLVLYHGERVWKVKLNFGSLFEGPEELKRYFPDFEYHLIDLSDYSDEEIIGEVLLQASLLLLKHIFDPALAERLPDIFGLLRELAQQQTGLEYLYAVLRYVSQAGKTVTEEDLRQAVETAFSKEGGALVATIAERWTEQGFEKGIEQGIKQGIELGKQEGIQLGKQAGRHEGLLAGIEMALELRFGEAGLQLLSEVQKTEDLEALRALYAGIITATTLDELRERLQSRTTEQKSQPEEESDET